MRTKIYLWIRLRQVRRYSKFDHQNETMLRLYRAWKRDNGTEFVRLPAKLMWRDPSVNLATRGFRDRSDLRRAIQVSVDEIRKLIGPIRLGATTISKLNRLLAMDDGIPGGVSSDRLKRDFALCVSCVIARRSCAQLPYFISSHRTTILRDVDLLWRSPFAFMRKRAYTECSARSRECDRPCVSVEESCGKIGR